MIPFKVVKQEGAPFAVSLFGADLIAGYVQEAKDAAAAAAPVAGSIAAVEAVAADLTGANAIGAAAGNLPAILAAPEKAGEASAARDQAVAARNEAVAAAAAPVAAIRVEDGGGKVMMTAAERATLAANPAKRSNTTRALEITGARRRVLGWLSGDGRAFQIARTLIDGSGRMTRFRHDGAPGGIDLHDTGAVSFAGEKRTAATDAGLFRRVIGRRRRLVEVLTGTEYRVHGLTVRTGGAGTELRGPDGTVAVQMPRTGAASFFGSIVLPDLTIARIGVDVALRNPAAGTGMLLHASGAISLTGERRTAVGGNIIRRTIGARRRVVEELTGTVWRMFGLRVQATATGVEMRGPGGQLILSAPRSGAPSFAGMSTGSVRRGDTYLRGGEILPVLPDMARIAGWGSSSMWYWGDNLATVAAAFGATFYAGGKPGERAEHTTARIGSHPARLTFPAGTIPGSGSVQVTVEGWDTSAQLMTFAGVVSGVAGTLATGTTTATATFTRSTAGAAVAVAGGAAFVPTDGMAQRDAVALLNLGKNNVPVAAWTADAILQRTHEAFDWLSPMIRRALVLGHFANTDDAMGGADWTKVQALNAGLRARYAPSGQYVDIDAFVGRGSRLFGKTVWEITGIAPTATDTAAQTEGRLPPSLSRDTQHTNEAADGAVAWLVRQHLTALSYYQEPQ